MSILVLRKICQEHEQETPFSGKLLLEYRTNGILKHLPINVQNIEWTKYITHYISNNLPKQQNKILVSEKQIMMSPQQQIEKCLDIMHKYNMIINTNDENKSDEMN
eukprot:214728_1